MIQRSLNARVGLLVVVSLVAAASLRAQNARKDVTVELTNPVGDKVIGLMSLDDLRFTQGGCVLNLKQEPVSPVALDAVIELGADKQPLDTAIEFLRDWIRRKPNVTFTFAPSEKRPPLVLFTWGNSLPQFGGVITSLSVKYTMFLPSGMPVRATVSVKITEAQSAKQKECSSEADDPNK